LFDSHNARERTGSRHLEPFETKRVGDSLERTRFRSVSYQSETGSTNDDASALLGTPAGAGLILLTDYQRSGKGRRSRSWIAPPRSALLFTAILPEPIQSRALWAIPFWSALAVTEGIERATSVSAALQWPNDLLLDGRKCCGILAVSRVMGERAWVGCGVGLNVHRPENDAELAGIDPPPAFLSDAFPSVEREPLLAAILQAFDAHLPILADPARIARAWEARALRENPRYRIALDDGETFEAQALRLDEDGSLIVRTADGERSVTLADARVLR
jgi:BirA family biotin operon repressor/biotin-[acetyl-CoA-carboxylase] ligase